MKLLSALAAVVILTAIGLAGGSSGGLQSLFGIWIPYLAVAVFIAAILILRGLPAEFVPSQDQSMLMIRLQAAVASDINETDQLFRKAEAILGASPEVTRIFGAVGGAGGGAISGSVSNGVLFVSLVPPSQRKVTQTEFSASVR